MVRLASLDQTTPFDAQLGQDTGPVVLVIEYAVPPDAASALLDLWRADVAGMARRPGFLGARLHLGTGASRMWHTTAEWESTAALAAALAAASADRALQEAAARLPDGVVAYPHIFERAPSEEARPVSQEPVFQERTRSMADNLTVASAERQREVVDQIWLVGLNQGDLSIADAHLTADFRNHGSHDDSLTGPESFKLTINKQRSGFSEIRYEILDFLSQGDRACVRWVMHGTHTGPFLGVPPTGKRVEHHAILILRFEGDKIAERWGIVDNFGLMRQLRGGPPGGPGSPGATAPAPRPLPDGPGEEPAGRWFGTVSYEGKRDDYAVAFRPDGSLALDTADSTGAGTWSMNSDGTFRFSVREEFRRAADGSVADKVLPGAAYIQIDFVAKAVGGVFSGAGTAEVRGQDGSLVHSTVAQTVANRIEER